MWYSFAWMISNETNQSIKTRLVFLGESEINEKQRPNGCLSYLKKDGWKDAGICGFGLLRIWVC